MSHKVTMGVWCRRSFCQLIPALAFALSSVSCSSAQHVYNSAPDVRPVGPSVILISIDGYRADYLSRHHSPTLEGLAKRGVHALLTPSFPALTLPNHYAMVTGLVPDHNGIVNNAMWDPELGRFGTGKNQQALSDGRWWAQGRPIWEVAHDNGKRSATVMWPGSGAEIHGIRPDHWFPYSAAATSSDRVRAALNWLDLSEDDRPDLIAVYLEDVDRAGHTFGPGSRELDQALSDVDDSLNLLIEGLKTRGLMNSVNIVVVSDHGMAAVAPDNVILIDKMVPTDRLKLTSLGVVAGIDPNPGYGVDELLAQLSNSGARMQCRAKEHMPPRFRYGSNSRVPKVICLAEPGWRISTEAISKKIKGQFDRGDHGYDNLLPEMQAIMVAAGPAFRRGIRLGSYANVDIFPLLISLLDLPTQPSDGGEGLARDALSDSEVSR